MRLGTRTTLAACAALALIAPGSAEAVTISDRGTDELVLTGDASTIVPIAYEADGFHLPPTTSGSSMHCVDQGNGYVCPYEGLAKITYDGSDANEIVYAYSFPDEAVAWPAGILFTLNGGAGNDDLAGGAGDDKIIGGPGRDRLRGKDGEDKINAKDGTEDRKVDCGQGKDPEAKVDSKDPKPVSC